MRCLASSPSRCRLAAPWAALSASRGVGRGAMRGRYRRGEGKVHTQVYRAALYSGGGREGRVWGGRGGERGGLVKGRGGEGERARQRAHLPSRRLPPPSVAARTATWQWPWRAPARVRVRARVSEHEGAATRAGLVRARVSEPSWLGAAEMAPSPPTPPLSLGALLCHRHRLLPRGVGGALLRGGRRRGGRAQPGQREDA
eukprot:scaffold133305_cov71-Phaeocystis_antarctica.AAC.5